VAASVGIPEDRRLFEARYDVTTAARHLHMPRSTLRAWTQGMGEFKRVLELPKPGYLSFVNLTEAFVLLAMRRRYSIALPTVRRAILYVQRQIGVAHPLAFQDFKTDYVDLFVRTAVGDVNVSRGGQAGIDAVLHELERIEWRRHRPIALFPIVSERIADERPIRISPLIAFGRPVIAGTRIPITAGAERFYGGESIMELSEDYGVPAVSIEEAVRAESKLIAA
jgi:uncharacterized protein (DUF433 family)